MVCRVKIPPLNAGGDRMTYIIAVIMAIMVFGSIFTVMGVMAKALFDFLMWPFVEIVKMFLGR